MAVISEAALSAYSFIIQSNVCLSPVALALLPPPAPPPHLHSSSTTSLGNQTKPEAFIRRGFIPPNPLFRPIPFKLCSLVAARL